MTQEVNCGPCARLVVMLEGIRGPFFQERERRGLGHSYMPRPPAYRGGSVAVSPAFFDLVLEHVSAWLDAVSDEPEEHTPHLPEWARGALAAVNVNRVIGRDAAVQAAAAILGVSARSVYRRSRTA